MSLSLRDWLDRYAAAIGTDAPSAEEVDSLLSLAGIAAHASERTAAPLSCWLAARAGLSITEAHEAAKVLSDSLQENDQPDA
jgi:hypothetical protein